MERLDVADDRRDLRLRVLARPQHRRLARRPRRPQHLLRAAELRHQPVRELEDLRRRAVVLLQPEHLALRPQQVLRRRARERVDRLVVVADDAQLVPVAQPALEQRLLEQVHVLVLVDRERPVALAEDPRGLGVLVVEPDRELEQILEVDPALPLLLLLVAPEDALHQVLRDRRRVRPQPLEIRVRRQAPVLRPLDLLREIAERAELERRRQRAPDRLERQRLRREDLPDPVAGEEAELRQRRRVERPRDDAADAEPGQPLAHHSRGLVREGHGQDLRRLEGAGQHLVRDPARDRRRLARAGAGEDADRAAHGLDRRALLRVQPLEDVHRHTGELRPGVGGPVKRIWNFAG